MEPGSFSVFSDENVRHTSSVESSFDLDGVCLVSRYNDNVLKSVVYLAYCNRSLDAFCVCPLGESRVYTDGKVLDRHTFLYKARIFNLDQYDEAHRQYASFNPGFKLFPLSGGGDLHVVGALL